MTGHHIEVHQPDIGYMGTTVKIDGRQIRRVREIEYRCAVDEVPEVKISLMGINDFDINSGYIIVDICPENVKDAVVILRDELLKHGDIYDAFVASVDSSLKEQGVQALPFQPTDEIAERIIKRISGEE